MTRTKPTQAIIWMCLLAFSMFVTLFVLLDFNKPDGYELLFMIPLTFTFLSMLLNRIYQLIPSNLGITVLIALFFCRMVASPFLMVVGDYKVTITHNVAQNTPWATLLVCYEALAVFFLLYYLSAKKLKPSTVKMENQTVNAKYAGMVLVIILVLIACIGTVPELMEGYRTIFDITDEHFTNYEDSFLVEEYGTSFSKKLAMVLGNYLMRAAIVLIPGFLITWISRYKNNHLVRLLSLLACFVPLFFIPGGIARCLIYVLCLLLLRGSLFGKTQRKNSRVYLIVALGSLAAVGWWIYRSNLYDDSFKNIWEYYSARFSAYFSSVNIVSGVFNMPGDIEHRILFFFYDYLKSIPFSNTLFNLSQEAIQPFFNSCNFSNGQIPTTIGMTYYYFGPILAPIYSMIFSWISFKAGQRISLEQNPMARLRWILMAFYFSMGVIMYNIEILMTGCFTLFIPLYLMELIAFRRKGEKKHDSKKNSLLLVRR